MERFDTDFGGRSSHCLLFYFWTVHFHPFGPSTFSLFDHSLIVFWIVYLKIFGPSSFIHLGRPNLAYRTVQFLISGPSTFADRPLRVFWTVQFDI